MKNIKALLRLDYQLVRTYWKWWLSFFALSIFMSIVNRSGATNVLIFSMFAMTLMALPFEVADKNNLNVLFATLPTNRKSLLFARYAFMALSLVAVIIISVITGLAIDLISGNSINITEYLTFTSLSICVFLVAAGIQTPFFYRHGYAKGRIFMWIPLIVIIIVINLPALFDLLSLDIEFDIFQILFRNVTVTSIVSLCTGVLAFVISYLLSRRIYLKKDF